jgi:integrase
MARKATGQVIERGGKQGIAFVLRFTAYGKRRHLTVGNAAEGYTRAKAEEELRFVLAQVQRGIWLPPEAAPTIAEPEPEPSFHEFASEWYARHRGEWRPRTADDYRWALSNHLLPFFRDHRLSQITAREIDRYAAAKLTEGALSNGTINKTLIRLGQILAEAVEYELLDASPLEGRAGRRRRLKAEAPRRASLDARQARALLDAAGRHLPLIRTALMGGGLRVSELTHLRWRDVQIASAKMRVAASKTDAGVREIDLAPELLHELRAYKASARWSAPSDFVFPGNHRRRPRERSAVARLLRRAIERANEQLKRDGWDPIPDGATFHSLRRTYASLMVEAGADPAYTMKQIGHRRSSFTLEIYTDVKTRRDAANERLGALLAGEQKAHKGANGPLPPPSEAEPSEAKAEHPA